MGTTYHTRCCGPTCKGDNFEKQDLLSCGANLNLALRKTEISVQSVVADFYPPPLELRLSVLKKGIGKQFIPPRRGRLHSSCIDALKKPSPSWRYKHFRFYQYPF